MKFVAISHMLPSLVSYCEEAFRVAKLLTFLQGSRRCACTPSTIGVDRSL